MCLEPARRRLPLGLILALRSRRCMWNNCQTSFFTGSTDDGVDFICSRSCSCPNSGFGVPVPFDGAFDDCPISTDCSTGFCCNGNPGTFTFFFFLIDSGQFNLAVELDGNAGILSDVVNSCSPCFCNTSPDDDCSAHVASGACLGGYESPVLDDGSTRCIWFGRAVLPDEGAPGTAWSRAVVMGSSQLDVTIDGAAQTYTSGICATSSGTLRTCAGFDRR